VGDPGGVGRAAKTLADTLWIADWSFDSGGGCDAAGWTKYDNHILKDGSNYWSVSTAYTGSGLIVGDAAVLKRHDPCWSSPDGYGNFWDYSLVVRYRGATHLTFDYEMDSEPGYDFLRVEADSACASNDRVNYTSTPGKGPSDYRVLLYSDSGRSDGTVSVDLPDFGVAGSTHCAYLRFVSDPGGSQADGMFSTLGAALVIDNLSTTGGGISIGEDFTGSMDPNVAFVNSAPATPFGEWARLYRHVTDNDKCTENTTCAWLWSDPNLVASDASTLFGPGGAVLHSWLDDIIVSPWVSLGSTGSGSGTVLAFHLFPGNPFATSRILMAGEVRSRSRVDNTDTPTPGDSVDCTSEWNVGTPYSPLNGFSWVNSLYDITAGVLPQGREIQVRFRVVDVQFAGVPPPDPVRVGPGPFLDHVRIGRRPLAGPAINELLGSSQANDAFPTYRNSIIPGEHYSPSADRFGTCAFSEGYDLGWINSSNLVTGDSIWVKVQDVRRAGGIASVDWYGAIVAGPHQGKAPAPYSVGVNGFFRVPADSCRFLSSAATPDFYFIDLDDTYFRGGDALVNFWAATDGEGGFSSDPEGLPALPVSVHEAEFATGGLLQVDFLPSIAWDPGYRARIAADAHGDLDPTPAELANSHQANCILYAQTVNPRRRSGLLNRTSFMYTLDELGYRGHYDVYDVQGYENSNNQLGGRASPSQATGYALIIQDTGRGTAPPNLPDGHTTLSEKIDQAQWYRDYLANASLSEIGTATLWLVGENLVSEKPANALLAVDMGVTLAAPDQGLAANPDVAGQTSFGFANGPGSSCVASFAGDRFSLSGGCPAPRDYDGLAATNTGVVTHRFASGSVLGSGAIVMNTNSSLHWNTIMSSFGWFDIRDPQGGVSPAYPGPAASLAKKILNCTLPIDCRRSTDPTGVEPDDAAAAPLETALLPCVPNPFNPVTAIRFDLARSSRVQLGIFDVAGHRVRALVEGTMEKGRHTVMWNGLADTGRRVSAGVYFLRLTTPERQLTEKIVALE
jgi:hypothetical protein